MKIFRPIAGFTILFFVLALFVIGCATGQGRGRAMTPGRFMVEADGYLINPDGSPITYQLIVTVSRDRILDVEWLGAERAQSIYLGMPALPILRERVLVNQTADVDVVTGCTITSFGFSMAVNEALRQAGAPSRMLLGSRRPVRFVDVTENVDILVIGSGISGLTAALKAKKDAPDARVVVIEKSEITGGTTRMSGWIIQVPYRDTADDIEAFWRYYEHRAQGTADINLLRRWANSAPGAYALLRGTGTTINRNAINVDPRMISGISMSRTLRDPLGRFGTLGAAGPMVDGMVSRLGALGVPVMTGVEATSLILNDARNAVVGVRAVAKAGINYTFNVSSGVIIATGGHAYNRDLMAEFHTELARYDLPGGSPTHRGTGFLMGRNIGADYLFKGGQIGLRAVYGATRYTWLTGGHVIASDGTFPNFGINNGWPAETGPNFMGFNVPRQAANFPESIVRPDHLINAPRPAHLGGGVMATNIEEARAVANATIRAQGTLVWRWMVEKRAANPNITFYSISRSPAPPPVPHGPNVEAYSEETIAALAARLPAGINETNLTAAFALAPGTAGRFNAIRAVPSNWGTWGGLMIDEHARVLSRGTGQSDHVNVPRGQPIRGLYAAGEVASGQFFYLEYPRSGTALSLGMTFGYIAGRHAAGAFNTPLMLPRLGQR